MTTGSKIGLVVAIVVAIAVISFLAKKQYDSKVESVGEIRKAQMEAAAIAAQQNSRPSGGSGGPGG